MIFAASNVEDIEPLAMAHVTRGEPEGTWEDDGWGFYDDIGFVCDNEDVFGQTTNNLIQTNIPGTHPNFARILELTISNANVCFSGDRSEISQSEFQEKATSGELRFLAISECSPDL